MVFKKDLIKFKKKYKIHTIRKDIKNLKYVKTIKMYKILTEIDLNYKFKKITFKNIQNHGLTDCLAKGVKILDGIRLNYKFKKVTFKNQLMQEVFLISTAKSCFQALFLFRLYYIPRI